MEFDETPRFAPMKTYGPISVDLRKKVSLYFSPFPLFSLTLSIRLPSFLFFFLFTFFFFFLSFSFPFYFVFFLIWIHGSYCAICPSLIQVRLCPETIYFFLVQFILNEISSNHFMTSDIFIKISSLKALATYHLENRKNIPTISEFDENFLCR